MATRYLNPYRFIYHYPNPLVENKFSVDLPNGAIEKRIGTFATLEEAIAARDEALKSRRRNNDDETV